MARISRKEYGIFQIFHVMVQGINKEYIFNNNKNKESYLNLIRKYKEEYNISIYNYAMMDNHAHFLFHVKEIEDLSEFMRMVNTIYAQKYNSETKRVGYVFRGRFKSVPIENNKHFRISYKYISNNPVKASITEDIKNYIYSGEGKYKNNLEIIDEIPEKLEFFHKNVNKEEIDLSKFPRYKVPEHREHEFEDLDEVISDIVEEDFEGNLKNKERVSLKKSKEIMDKIKYRTCITKKELKKLIKKDYKTLYKILFFTKKYPKKVK